MKVYNKNALTRNQRFNNALLFGLLACIILGILGGLVLDIIYIPYMSYMVYIGIGYSIGQIIQIKGKGVQERFSILAIVLTIISFIICDIISTLGLGIFNNLELLIYSFKLVISNNSIVDIIIKVIGIISAYYNARIAM